MIEIIDGRSIRTDLLSGRPVLDVGARGFIFAREMARRGHKVYALDPDPEVSDPKVPGVEFFRLALVGKMPHARCLVMHPDPEARYIAGVSETPKHPLTRVGAFTLAEMTRMIDPPWDTVKLNCEGEEYDILPNWPGPIARQIAVSFHEHYRSRGDYYIESIVQHLTQWYLPVRHEKDARHGAGLNFWDSLFCLKDIA